MQSENIPHIYKVLEVSKFDTSIDVNEEQFENNIDMLETFEVLKYDKFKDFIDLHLWNNPDIIEIDEVLNFDKSKEVKKIRSEKIHPIFWAELVLKLVNLYRC